VSISQSYRLTNSTLALFLEDGRHVGRTVAPGAVIILDSNAFDGENLINLTWDGREVMMFTQDLLSRAEAVSEKSNEAVAGRQSLTGDRMDCEEKERLLSEYQVAVAAYSVAVLELKRSRGTFNKTAHADLFRLARDTRNVSTMAWGDLETHILSHRC
jgi:hypothetical protein